jgi:hypothetical protein
MNVNGLLNKCRRYEASLSLLAAGVLGAPERAALETHLAGCAICRRKLSQLQHLTHGLTEAGQRFTGIEAPVSLRRRWMTEVRGSARARDSVRMPLIADWLSGRRLAWCSLAAMWMLVLFFRVSAPEGPTPASVAVPPPSLRQVLLALKVNDDKAVQRADAASPDRKPAARPDTLPPRSQRLPSRHAGWGVA